MQSIILYTKKIEFHFNEQGVSVLNLDEIIQEISKEYTILDHNPMVSTRDNFYLLTFKVGQKTESKGIGFNFGKKE
jgi:hypothetical protein